MGKLSGGNVVLLCSNAVFGYNKKCLKPQQSTLTKIHANETTTKNAKTKIIKNVPDLAWQMMSMPSTACGMHSCCTVNRHKSMGVVSYRDCHRCDDGHCGTEKGADPDGRGQKEKENKKGEIYRVRMRVRSSSVHGRSQKNRTQGRENGQHSNTWAIASGPGRCVTKIRRLQKEHAQTKSLLGLAFSLA